MEAELQGAQAILDDTKDKIAQIEEALVQFEEVDEELEEQAKSILQEMVHECGGKIYEDSAESESEGDEEGSAGMDLEDEEDDEGKAKGKGGRGRRRKFPQ